MKRYYKGSMINQKWRDYSSKSKKKLATKGKVHLSRIHAGLKETTLWMKSPEDSVLVAINKMQLLLRNNYRTIF